MRPVNGYFLFELGKVWQLLDIPVTRPIRGDLPAIALIMAYLQGFSTQEKNQADLPDSVAAANELIRALDQLTREPDRAPTQEDKSVLVHLLGTFRDRLFNELNKLHVWVLEEKQAYSINALWRNPLKLVTASAVEHLSDFVIENISEAAKCLLLDRFTAVGWSRCQIVGKKN